MSDIDAEFPKLPELEELEEIKAKPLARVARGLAHLAGAEVVPDEHLALLEAHAADRRLLMKEMDTIAWQQLDYMGGSEQDLKAVERRRIVQQIRVGWMRDPQIGSVVDLYNDFVLGRGVPKPTARDSEVQKVIDEAWEDEDNKLVLTTYPAQLALNTDLTLQSNLFLLGFGEGADGKFKLSMLDHDSVENVVRDQDNRRRITYFVARERRIKWDFENDAPTIADTAPDTKGHIRNPREHIVGPESYDGRIRYYQHHEHEPRPGQEAPPEKLGEGRVYSVALNRTGEMAFGHPSLDRVLRWANAFNKFMESRVDLAQAAAALIMKRKVKGTPGQVRQIANKALSRRSEIGRRVDPSEGSDGSLQGMRSGSVVTENEGVEHEAFNLNSGAQNANTDSQMIRSQISAASHMPQHYLGDVGSANLANATAMELPVIKAVESRQEVIEGIVKWFVDSVIERAIETGRLKKELSDKEYNEKLEAEAADGKLEAQTDAPEQPEITKPADGVAQPGLTEAEDNPFGGDATDLDNAEVPEGEPLDEEEEAEARRRDLGYTFKLPSPQKRLLADLVNSVSTVAKTFDPNGTNMELNRVLLTIIMGEGMEDPDPAEAVDAIFPEGYEDPALAAMKAAQQQQPPPGGGNPFGGGGITFMDGQNGGTPTTPEGEENPYGGKMRATPPEEVTEAVFRNRSGEVGVAFGRILDEVEE